MPVACTATLRTLPAAHGNAAGLLNGAQGQRRVACSTTADAAGGWVDAGAADAREELSAARMLPNVVVEVLGVKLLHSHMIV